MAVEKALISTVVGMVGFIGNKFRDYASNKLKDGDLTNEELREFLVRDSNKINAKLDSLSLKDLDASRSFLKEGLSILILALDKPSEGQETQKGPDEATDISTDGASGSLNLAITLPQVILSPIMSSTRFEEAKTCFQTARENATHAFNNQSLSIKDRITACEIRVAARILESGCEDPAVAVSACLLALEELHGLPAIKDMFNVFLSGGMRSWRNKAERLENIMLVLLINHALFDFASKCSSKYPNVYNWPRIELADRTLHPILHAYNLVKKTLSSNKKFGQQLNRMVVNRRIYFHDEYFAANSRGEIILQSDKKIKVIYGSGESKSVVSSDKSESNVRMRRRRALAVDSDDNVYVVRYLKTRDVNGIKENFALCIFDENYKIKHDSILLDFLNVGEYRDVQIAVDKNKNIIMITSEDNQVYVCDNTGKLKFKFTRRGGNAWALGITDQNDIMIPSDDRAAVVLYTAEGDLKFTIKVPEDHEVRQVAFHHGICKIIVLTCDTISGSWSLLCYSKARELNDFKVRDLPLLSGISSHPSGTFSVLQRKSITFI